ncbi:MAG: putative toxin-antitoxin system toxin component, PIN family [Ferrovum sp.]|jgi:hypothetical protein|nr:putative toxin-antitoxin system toxin component, PIN family [Ferrovum sp.]
MAVRVVLDTNCVISALMFSQQSMAWLRHLWQSGEIVPIVSKATTVELLRVLGYPKFKLSPEEQQSLLADFLPYAETLASFSDPPNLPEIRDKCDQMFLNLAVASHADALVTGDHDLLVIKPNFTILPIMTLGEFRIWLESRRPV